MDTNLDSEIGRLHSEGKHKEIIAIVRKLKFSLTSLTLPKAVECVPMRLWSDQDIEDLFRASLRCATKTSSSHLPNLLNGERLHRQTRKSNQRTFGLSLFAVGVGVTSIIISICQGKSETREEAKLHKLLVAEIETTTKQIKGTLGDLNKATVSAISSLKKGDSNQPTGKEE